MKKQINIIDLFAGPGGLGEGFYAYPKDSSDKPFKIRMSVEMEQNAHKTLQLRAFFRQFEGNAPEDYYDYARNPSPKAREELFNKYPEQAEAAIAESMEQPRELGKKSDDKDIEKKLRQLKKEDGPFVVIGGPPCQAYSNAGKSRNAGKKGYSLKKDIRAKLYKEYLNVINIIEPEVFVMENVKGILSSKIDGELIFDQILEDLRDPRKAIGKRTKHKYEIYSLVQVPDDIKKGTGPIYKQSKSFTINFEKYGIPQKRHRVILLGIRSDLGKKPGTLKESNKKISIESIIDGMPSLRSGTSKKDFTTEQRKNFTSENWHNMIASLGKDLVKRLKNSKDSQHASIANKYIKSLRNDLNQGDKFVASRNNGFKSGFKNNLISWLYDSRMKGFSNHDTRGHMKADLKRYFWAATYAELNKDRPNPSPKSHEYPKYLAPEHKNWNSDSKPHADRFRVQVRSKPSTTVTCHISKDGNYYIHYDPSQCRSLTVREAARLQTFPDNYLFEGGRTAQYVQVGNAVPPYLATQIADIVFSLLKS